VAKHQTTNLQALRPEIQQQRGAQSDSAQVVNNLGLVLRDKIALALA
jgi:hypothetical protein